MPKPDKPRLPKKPPAASLPPAEPLSGKTVTTGLNLPGAGPDAWSDATPDVCFYVD